MRLPLAALILTLGCATASTPRAPTAPDAEPSGTYLAELKKEASRLAPAYPEPLVASFLAAHEQLEPIAPRVLFRDEERDRYCTEEQLPEPERARCSRVDIDERRYYSTSYGTPMTYAQPLAVLARDAGLESVAGKKILDFGYGYIGHMKMLASLGAEMHGVDVHPLLPVLYSWPGDQGPLEGGGSVTLHHGRFPADAAVTDAIGDGYDVIWSKNVLKRGYIHPEREADPKHLVHLGVDDATFLQHLNRALVPGGLVLIYNLYPRQSPPDQPYIPWADGRCPFTRDDWQRAGFEVLVFDRDDTEAVRQMAKTLGWDEPSEDGPGMNLDDLFALYTLVKKVGAPAP